MVYNGQFHCNKSYQSIQCEASVVGAVLMSVVWVLYYNHCRE